MAYEIKSMKSVGQQLNNLTYSDYYYRLMLIARSVFEWEGLPEGMNEKWIEKFLYHHGRCIFFEDETKGLMVSKCNDAGGVNSYDEPTILQPYGIDYTGKSLTNYKECIVIQNNDICTPTHYTIQQYAYKLADISRTIDININAQKTPYLVIGSEKQKHSLKQAFKQIENNEPALFLTKDFDLDSVKVLKTDAPIVFDKLQQQKHAIWNECMTFLGVNNANMDKRERLVDDEVQANNEQVGISAEVMLKSREYACEQINKLFGTKISVKRRQFKAPLLEDIETEPKEDEDNVC